MGYQIRMAPGKWLAEFNAYIRSGRHGRPAPSEAPRWILGQIGYRVAQPGLDAAYQQHLMALTRARRAVADVATSRKRLELQIGELERQAGEHADRGRRAMDAGQGGTADAGRGGAADHGQTPRAVSDQLADLRRRYADLQAKEERVTAASRRLVAETHAFRAGQEATKAAHTAAEQAAGAVWAEVG